MGSKKLLRGLGVALKGKKIFLFYSLLSPQTATFQVDTSLNGFDFGPSDSQPEIITEKKRKEDIRNCRDFRITELTRNKHFLTCQLQTKKQASLCGAFSKDLLHWRKIGKIAPIKETGMVVPHFLYRGKLVLYFGEKEIKIAFSKDLKRWEISRKPILSLASNPPENTKMTIGNLIPTKKGILLLYYQSRSKKNLRVYSIKMALFDKKKPDKLLWRSDKPVWEQPKEWRQKKVTPIGLIKLKSKLISYWQIESEGILAVSHFPFRPEKDIKLTFAVPFLRRFGENPILKPIIQHFWESKAVFNPAAVYEAGKVHLVYRAVGEDHRSVLGYAASSDGINIDERLKKPIYLPIQFFEGNLPKLRTYCSISFTSGGGGHGGCEDPRITKIDDRFYMIYVAYDGQSPPRLALTSISSDDFLNHRWNWQKAVLISRPGRIDKSGALLPEKINNKYVIFHRVFPNILIDFVDSLDFDGKTWLEGEFSISPRKDSWDSRKIGVGPPPIKTDEGWLVIYNAVDDKDDSRYKMGAMLLDLKDPTQVLHRANAPVLEAAESYENGGLKYGVVYPCGAAVIKNRLFVYYGGSDMVACVATASLSEFLRKLKYSGLPQLKPLAEKTHLVYH